MRRAQESDWGQLITEGFRLLPELREAAKALGREPLGQVLEELAELVAEYLPAQVPAEQ